MGVKLDFTHAETVKIEFLAHSSKKYPNSAQKTYFRHYFAWVKYYFMHTIIKKKLFQIGMQKIIDLNWWYYNSISIKRLAIKLDLGW